MSKVILVAESEVIDTETIMEMIERQRYGVKYYCKLALCCMVTTAVALVIGIMIMACASASAYDVRGDEKYDIFFELLQEEQQC